ncbi:MAG: DUF983 domain-containing protein [Rhizobiales bacterium]|nr:DUF983 domain-containing protein [Hyphomicrobiales bacterium]
MQSVEVSVPASDSDHKKRSVFEAMSRGKSNKCPQCGVGKLFAGYTRIVDSCEHCGTELHHHRADDAPPYFTIFIVGHIVVGLMLWLEKSYHPELWIHMALWVPLTIVLALWLLRPIKGAVVGLQWANRMHGFGGDSDSDY